MEALGYVGRELDGFGVGYVEHDALLVEVVEVPRVLLIEVVGELALRTPRGGHARVEVGYSASVTVEHHEEDARLGDFFTLRSVLLDGLELDGA